MPFGFGQINLHPAGSIYLPQSLVFQPYAQLFCLYQKPKEDRQNENEYRSTIFKGSPLSEVERKYIVDPTIFQKIILSAYMPENIEFQLRNSFPDELTTIPIVRASIVQNRVIF